MLQIFLETKYLQLYVSDLFSDFDSGHFGNRSLAIISLSNVNSLILTRARSLSKMIPLNESPEGILNHKS